MIFIACLKCSSATRVAGDMEGSENLVGPGSDWWPSSFPCRKAGCDGKAQVLESVDPEALAQFDIVELTPQEAFVAFHGLGVPEEQECGVLAVEQIFQKPIKRVRAWNIKGAGRSVIDFIEFDDGTRMYLGASTYGATVYRIAKVHSYTESALNG